MPGDKPDFKQSTPAILAMSNKSTEITGEHVEPNTPSTASSKSDNKKSKVNSIDVAVLFLEKTPLAYCDQTDRFFSYDNSSGYWNRITDNHLMRSLAKWLEQEAAPEMVTFKQAISVSKLSELLRNLKLKAPLWKPEVTHQLISINNGVLDLTGAQPSLRPHDPTLQLLGGLEVNYDPSAACPQFMEFLASGLSVDDIDLLQRYAGGLLMGRNRQQVIMLLIGKPGVGKGTLVELLGRLVGPGNTGELRINKLAERFEVSSFSSKRLLIANEVASDVFSDKGCNQLKALVGGDLMNPEAKRKQERTEVIGDFQVVLHTNEVTQQPWSANLEAFQRRLLVVTYDKPSPTRVIPDLAKTLWQQEASGILNWAVAGALRLKAETKHSGCFSQTEIQKQRVRLILGPKPPELSAEASKTLPPTPSLLSRVVVAVKRAWRALTSTKKAQQ